MDAGSSKPRASILVIACGILIRSATTVCLLTAFPAMSREVPTSEFLAHCEAAPEPCKETVLAYVKFLAEGGFLNHCIMQLPAGDVAAKLIGWMRDHPEYAEKDWVDCLDDAVSKLKPCNP